MTFVPPPPAPTLNTPAWARQQLQAFTPDAQRAITDLVALSITGTLISELRIPYAKLCMDQRWQGWQARLAWTIVELLARDARGLGPGTGDDDIPF